MFILDGAVVTSPSDLTALSACEFAFARVLDAKLGRLEAVPVDDDPMLRRAGALGDVHEGEQLARYRAQHPDAVVEIERPYPLTRESLRAAAAATEEAFRSGAPVVFQATFFDETEPTRTRPRSATPTSSCGNPTAAIAYKTPSSRARSR